MNSAWDGKERRSRNDFEREVCDFMARIDQRNMDKDIQNAAMYETVMEHDCRIQKMEHWQSWLTGAWVAASGLLGLWIGHGRKG